MPLVRDPPRLGGTDGHGDDLVHGQLRAAGNIAAQRDPQALLDHLPHGAQTRADIHVGIGAVYHHHTGVADGLPLPLIGVDTVRHQCVILPQTVFVVCLPVLRTVGMQLPHQLDLTGVLRQMGLHIQSPLPRQLAQRRHQLVGAAGGKARREDGLDVFKMAAIQPPHCLPDGLLRRLLQNAGQTVAVHVHLPHIAGDTGTLQLVHQDPCGLRVQGGKHTHPRGAAGDEVAGQPAVHPPGVVRVGKPRLRGKRVGTQPVQQW